MSCSEYPSHIPVRTARPSLSPQPRAALQCIPATVRTWLPAPAAKPSPRQDPRPFTDGYGAPGDQAFPGRKMQPGQSSVLGAATASLKISIPIFVIIVCLGGRTPRPPPLLRPPPLAASPKNMPFSALSLAGVRTLCSHVRGLVYVPGCGGCPGAGETAGSAGLSVSALLRAGSMHVVFTSHPGKPAPKGQQALGWQP